MQIRVTKFFIPFECSFQLVCTIPNVHNVATQTIHLTVPEVK